MSPRQPDVGEPSGDPYAAFGYLVAGPLFYGAIGWGLSGWLNAPYLLPIGILVGVGFGMYLVFVRYRYLGEGAPPTLPVTPIQADRPPDLRADRSDRGDHE